MATSLVTSKMNPALAARVEKSVRGGRMTSPATRRLIAIARVAAVVLIGFGIYSFFTGRRQERENTDSARASLLSDAEALSTSIDEEDKKVVARTQSWLEGVAAPAYAGDVIADELRTKGALKSALARPTLYVRGPIDGFGSPEQMIDTAARSPKDAFLLCLFDPPAARTEKAVLDKVRVAYYDTTKVEETTPSVRVLHEAFAGIPYFLPAWSDRVRAAESVDALERLRKEFDRAPTERAKEAARARQFLVVVDELGDPKDAVELDGERPHFVRVTLVELKSSQILLSLRKHVDPSWLSENKRPDYAKGADGCALAFDLQAALAEPPKP